MSTGNEYISECIAVPAAFEEVFTHFYRAANHSYEAIHKTLLPTFQTIMVFSFGADVLFTAGSQHSIAIEKCMVLGPLKQPVDYTLPAGADMLVANFKADAFYRFFGQVLVSQQMPVHPDELINENCFTNLWRQLKEFNSPTEQVNFILHFCQPYLKERDTTIERLTGLQESETGINPVKAIAQETQQSERSIQLKHKKYFGYSAKEINRYQRFAKAIELLQQIATSTQKPDWFEIIHQCGYYDQSQLIHDFKHYLKLSPTQFLQFEQDICIPKPA